MKLLLRKDIKGVGRRGDIVDVKPGYARNYLIPTGAGLIATDDTASQAAAMRKARDLRDAKSREAAEVQKTAIESTTLTISARAGSNGRLFGSVTESDIVNAIRTATNVSLDRHAVRMAEHLKELGSATVTVVLFDGVEATVSVDVVAKA
jgi:large subunit ribosomal protein L9